MKSPKQSPARCKCLVVFVGFLPSHPSPPHDCFPGLSNLSFPWVVASRALSKPYTLGCSLLDSLRCPSGLMKGLGQHDSVSDVGPRVGLLGQQHGWLQFQLLSDSLYDLSYLTCLSFGDSSSKPGLRQQSWRAVGRICGETFSPVTSEWNAYTSGLYAYVTGLTF